MYLIQSGPKVYTLKQPHIIKPWQEISKRTVGRTFKFYNSGLC